MSSGRERSTAAVERGSSNGSRPRGGLLHHFRSKEDLLVPVLARTDEFDRERYFAREFDWAADLFRTPAGLAEHNTRRLGRTRMFNVLAAEAGDPAHACFRQRYADVVQHASRTLRRAVAAGEPKPDTGVVAGAEELAAVMDGLQLQWVLASKDFDLVGHYRAYADRLLR